MVGSWCKGKGPECCDVCQAVACTAAGWATHCDDINNVIAGHAVVSKQIVYGAPKALMCFLSDKGMEGLRRNGTVCPRSWSLCMKVYQRPYFIHGVCSDKCWSYIWQRRRDERMCGCSCLTCKLPSSPIHWYVSQYSHLLD